MTYKISREAGKDLRSIWAYTFEKWSLEQANRYYNLIMNEIEFIANNPDSGNNYSHVKTGYFRSSIKSHFIFYKINSLNKEVEIIRILHQRMDIQSRLEE